MKKLLSSLLLPIIIGGMISCRHELDSADDGNKRNHSDKERPELKTLTMSFGGDIVSESDEPLQRAITRDGGIYTAINVFRTEKDVPNANEEKYAYGLFLTKDGISIKVLTGYTYRFEATVLIERDDKVWINGSNYDQPFQLNYQQNLSGALTSYHSSLIGRFQYTSENSITHELVEDDKRSFFQQLRSGTVQVDAGADLPSRYAPVRYPRIKRFYGTTTSFDPSISEEVTIPMDYKSFGLKFILDEIPVGSSISVSDVTPNGNKRPDTDPEWFLVFQKNMDFNTDGEWEGIYSLNDLRNDTEQFTLRFYWINGKTPSPYFDHSITVNANMKKVLKLKIDGEVNDTKSGNITLLNIDEADLSEETAEVISHDFKKS